MPGSILQIETRAGAPVTAGGVRIVPMARSIRLKIPGLNGGLIWNRPVAVVAMSPGGQEQTLPVRDITRQVQLALFAVALLGPLFLWLVFRLVDGKRDQEKEIQG